MLKKYSTLLSIVICFCFSVTGLFADDLRSKYSYFYPSNQLKFLDQNQDTLINAFAGGFILPQFSAMDLNGNGIEDLVIFEKSDRKIITFINNGDSENPEYYFAPEYASAFPDGIYNFLILQDYNKNGLKDIFTGRISGGGFSVFKNVSENGELAFELEYEQIRRETGDGSRTRIYVANTDLPAIGDVSGDGTLDILAFGSGFGTLPYYRNLSYERYGHFDSLIYVTEEHCWGRFSEGGEDNTIMYPINYIWCGLGKNSDSRHDGGAIVLFDHNGDGAKDLLLSDTDYPSLKLLINGKHSLFEDPYRVDTIIDVINFYPESKPVHVANMPAPYLIDVNNNGKRDLIVAPNDVYGAITINQIWYYRNVGTDQVPEFEFEKNNFLQSTMIDLGKSARPAFFDYNGNGLMDLIVVVLKDTMGNSLFGDRIYLFENVGDPSKAVYQLIDDDFLEISQYGWESITPAFGDINGNGKTDLLFGRLNGRIAYFKNTAEANENANFVLEDDFYDGIDVGNYSAPTILDFNGDGKPDLLVGKENGKISYFERTGNLGDHEYNLVTSDFGAVNVARFFNDIPWYQAYSTPIVADINGDGTSELIVGSFETGVHIYRIAENPTDTFERIDSIFYVHEFEDGRNKVHGRFTFPAVADVTNDTLVDILIGHMRGGLYAYTSQNFGPIAPPDDEVGLADNKALDRKDFKIYPNPAADYINVQPLLFFHHKLHSIHIYDLFGRSVFSDDFESGIEAVNFNVSNLRPAIYIVHVADENNKIVYKSKLSIHR